jgi:acetyl esterase/lipase
MATHAMHLSSHISYQHTGKPTNKLDLFTASNPQQVSPSMDSQVILVAPQLDPEWLQFEKEDILTAPRKVYKSVLDRQPIYAEECRALHARMMAPGARDHYLSLGVKTAAYSVPSTADEFRIPILQYDLEGTTTGTAARTVVVYYHGGGLQVGEADSEDLSCRRILKSGLSNVTVYSVGYRLMPKYAAKICVSDAVDAFNSIRCDNPGAKVVVVGSSSGGELAAFVSQMTESKSIDGLLLRCPVTSDAFSGPEFVPRHLRSYHTSVADSFVTSLLGFMNRKSPRDGLERMPLEASTDELNRVPKAWIQVCTNDTLYSDGICYGKALQDAGVNVRLDVVKGWPHTFWLKAPHLERAYEADLAMVNGLRWLCE